MRRMLAIAAVAALAGCAVGPNYHAPALRVPDHYAFTPPPASPSPDTSSSELASWWQALHDRELDSLIERAVKANPDLQIALDRLQAARTYEAGVLGTVLPTIQASAGGGRGTGSDIARSRASQTLVSAETGGFPQVNAIVGFDAVWELDVFGKFRRELEAARYDADASMAARDAVLVSVIADVARAYIDLRGLQARSAVLKAAIDVMRESLRIASIRYERGITNELDVTLAQRELATLQAQAAPVQSEIGAAQYAIATLLGLYPEDLVAELTPAAAIPMLPASVQTGMPLDLLRRRPDVQQSERQLAASTARIGVAIGNLFPQIAVTAAVGYQKQGFGVTPALSEHIWSAGPAAAWRLLDFGQLDAQVRIADLQTRALLVQYKKTIQGAVQQVDSALSAYTAEQQALGNLNDALLASQRSVTLANERYERGLTDFLNVIDAERQQYSLEEQFTDTQVASAEQFIALYRSLGGGWQGFQSIPPIDRPLPAILAIFKETIARPDPQKQANP